MKQIIQLIIVAFIVMLSTDGICNERRRTSGRPTRFVKPSGGLVFSKLEGKALCVLDLQDLASDGTIDDATRNIMLHIRVPMKVLRGNRNSSVEDNIRSFSQNTDVAALVVLTSDSGKDSMLYYPDRNVCIVNLKSLMKDGPDKATFNGRVFKQIWRSIGMILGAGEEAVGGFSILQKVNSLQQLDSIKAKLPSPEQHNRMVEAISALGMSMIKAGTYRTACQQGWAPAPTNEIQKAIWKEIHALPKNPIKIMPETKKVTR